MFFSALVAGVGTVVVAACNDSSEDSVNSRAVNDTTTSEKAVAASFFGMHTSSAIVKPWPELKFQTLRTWDQWPGVSWRDLNPADGVFRWGELDALVDAASEKSVDIVYTFGYVPSWASTGADKDCSGNTAGTCRMPNLAAWRNFVGRVTDRYRGRIKYWELWNEPNASNFWQGTTVQLVSLAEAAYGVIKNIGGTVLSPAPQGTNAHVWLDGYFEEGGAAFTDIVSFHGYLHGAPELITALAQNLRSVMAKHGLLNAPLWDTEHSWGEKSWPFGATPDEQSAWLGRFIILSAVSEISCSIWYMFDSKDWGSLADHDTGALFEPGIAHREIYRWLLGASISFDSLLGGVYQCKLSRTLPYQGLIVWDTNTMGGQSTRFKPPSGYTQYRTVTGKVVSIVENAPVEIGMKPILFEKAG